MHHEVMSSAIPIWPALSSALVLPHQLQGNPLQSRLKRQPGPNPPQVTGTLKRSHSAGVGGFKCHTKSHLAASLCDAFQQVTTMCFIKPDLFHDRAHRIAKPSKRNQLWSRRSTAVRVVSSTATRLEVKKARHYVSN